MQAATRIIVLACEYLSGYHDIHLSDLQSFAPLPLHHCPVPLNDFSAGVT